MSEVYTDLFEKSGLNPSSDGPYQIRNVRMEGNEHSQLAANTIYAELCNRHGHVVIAATLERIFQRVRDAEIPVEGVTVQRGWKRGAWCTSVCYDPVEATRSIQHQARHKEKPERKTFDHDQ